MKIKIFSSYKIFCESSFDYFVAYTKAMENKYIHQIYHFFKNDHKKKDIRYLCCHQKKKIQLKWTINKF